jgi:hypothetical protein
MQNLQNAFLRARKNLQKIVLMKLPRWTMSGKCDVFHPAHDQIEHPTFLSIAVTVSAQNAFG